MAEGEIVAALRSGDAVSFGVLTDRYRRPLLVHCYRMVASLDDAEDLVQETFLRAWRGRADFEGRSLVRTWLYRIATNVCLNALARTPRRVLVANVPAQDADAILSVEARPDLGAPPAELPWIQPFPDHLLQPLAPDDSQPDEAAVRRETIELVFLATIQHLSARQRAILLLRDVLGLSASETADQLGLSVDAVNSALRRARSTLRRRLPARPLDWSNATRPTDAERAVLRRFIDAHERADVAAFTALLREDVRQTMPPHLLWYDGRTAVATRFARYIDPSSPEYPGHVQLVPTSANSQPAAAVYLRARGEREHRLVGMSVLQIDGEQISAIVSFGEELLGRFGLEPTL
jgi:RNA polymerase sigma-70 factor (ECF subfamily)